MKYLNPAVPTCTTPLDYYKSFAWDGLRYMDPNDILNLPINSTYGGYRAIVIQNSTVCN